MNKMINLEQTAGLAMAHFPDRSFCGIKEILVPIDLTLQCRKAMDQAVNVAKLWNSHVTLLHVYQPPYNLSYLRGSHVHEAIEEHRQNSKQIFRRFGKELSEKWPTCSTEFRQGALCDEIAKAANDLHADLMIIGTHGNKWLQRMAYGSEAEAIVRRASCPVLVVREYDNMVFPLSTVAKAMFAEAN